MRVLHEPHRRLLQLAERLAERLDVRLHRRVGALLLDEAAAPRRRTPARRGRRPSAACGRRGRAPGCRWRPRRSWRCAHRARTAPCRARRYSRGRRTSAAPAPCWRSPWSVSTPLITGVSRPMWSSAAWRAFASSERCATSACSAVHSTSARAASLKALIVISVRRTSGCTMIGSAGLSVYFAPGERAALQPLLGVGDGVLIGDLGLRQPLHADAEPRLVHHREHGGEAAIFLADQPAGGAVVVHHAGRVAVDAHLLFDRAAGHARCARRASRPASAGTSARRTARCRLVPSGAPSMRASTRWMMLSARSCSPAEMKILVPVIL